MKQIMLSAGQMAEPIPGLNMDLTLQIFKELFVVGENVGCQIEYDRTGVCRQTGRVVGKQPHKIFWRYARILVPSLASKAFFILAMETFLFYNTFEILSLDDLVHLERFFNKTQAKFYKSLMRSVILQRTSRITSTKFDYYELQPFLGDFFRVVNYHSFKTIRITFGEEPEGWLVAQDTRSSNRYKNQARNLRVEDVRKMMRVDWIKDPIHLILETHAQVGRGSWEASEWGGMIKKAFETNPLIKVTHIHTIFPEDTSSEEDS